MYNKIVSFILVEDLPVKQVLTIKPQQKKQISICLSYAGPLFYQHLYFLNFGYFIILFIHPIHSSVSLGGWMFKKDFHHILLEMEKSPLECA